MKNPYLIFILVSLLITLAILGCAKPAQSPPPPTPPIIATPSPTPVITTTPQVLPSPIPTPIPTPIASPVPIPVATPVVTPTPKPEQTPVPAPSPSPVAQAQEGLKVYSENCARCHGQRGEGLIGPALIGQRHDLAKYSNVKSLFNFTRSFMPQDAPGSLREQDYWDVVAFILNSNKIIDEETFNPGAAEGISLGK